MKYLPWWRHGCSVAPHPSNEEGVAAVARNILEVLFTSCQFFYDLGDSGLVQTEHRANTSGEGNYSKCLCGPYTRTLAAGMRTMIQGLQ